MHKIHKNVLQYSNDIFAAKSLPLSVICRHFQHAALYLLIGFVSFVFLQTAATPVWHSADMAVVVSMGKHKPGNKMAPCGGGWEGGEVKLKLIVGMQPLIGITLHLWVLRPSCEADYSNTEAILINACSHVD